MAKDAVVKWSPVSILMDIQLIDWCISVARTCSLILIVLDVMKPLQHKRIIEHELEGFGIRLNKTPPNIVFRKKDKGGLNLTSLVR
jgi:ribosome-interacting GTPase 1